jgi:hypothetical protein
MHPGICPWPPVVAQVYSNAMDCLSEEDRQLPAVDKLLPMLQVRGAETTPAQYPVHNGHGWL